jgi:ABC-type transport system involved in multi-copper enzyme maturation permease subunit
MKHFSALYWKETRQVYGFVLVFIGCILIAVVVGRDVDPANHRKAMSMIDLFQAMTLSFSIILGFLLATGLRIIEKSNHVHLLLSTKPLAKKTLFWGYFLTGLLNWLIWLGCSLVMVIGYCMYKGILNDLFEGNWFYLLFASFLYIYTLNFSMGILWPNLYTSIIIAALGIFHISLFVDSPIEIIFTVLLAITALVLSYVFYTRPSYTPSRISESTG